MDCSRESQCSVAAATASVLRPSAASNRVCYIPSPKCSNKNGVNQSGTRSVCGRDGISIVSSTGLLRQHGPRGNECKGSRSRSYPGSQKSFTARRAKCSVGEKFSQAQSLPLISNITAAPLASATQLTTATTISAATEVSTPLAQSSPEDAVVIQRSGNNSNILKRIPKGGRPAAANLLTKLIHAVLHLPVSSSNWSRLFDFSSACLVKPNRGGKSRNLTAHIVKQIRQCELGEETCCAPSSFHPLRYTKSMKADDESIALMASVKLEDGDVKGAVRLLCSDDRLAVPQESTFAELCRLHPVAPFDRRPVPDTDTSPLHVSPSAVRAAIQSFPNSSSAGPDGLRPQHLKDLLIGSADDSLLLVAVTDLVNLLLEGKAPPSVQGSLFGAKLQAIAKKNGGIRPIAVGYVWRRLTAKVACNHVKEASAALLAPR
jgi:hypothetical protein